MRSWRENETERNVREFVKAFNVADVDALACLYNWIARPLYNPPKTFLLEGRYKNRDKLLRAHNRKPYSRREDRLPRLCKKENSRPFGYHSFRRAFA